MKIDRNELKNERTHTIRTPYSKAVVHCVLWGCIAASVIFVAACGGTHPTTCEALAKSYRRAHEAKSINDVDRLIYWGNMPKQDKERILKGIAETFEKTITLNEVRPLPADFRMESGSYIYPFAPQKSLKVEFANPTHEAGMLVGTEYTIGVKDGEAWILYRSEDKPKM